MKEQLKAFSLSDLSNNPEFSFRSKKSLLLEASAGTGKTWSLERIILYLILDPAYRMNLDEILIVTFTEAATQELKERIRSLLAEFYRSPKARVNLLADLGKETMEIDQPLMDHLKKQLQNFNTAPIYTIHGFCSWVLSRYSLEAGLPIKFTLDQEAGAEAFQDYLRKTLLSKDYSEFHISQTQVYRMDEAERNFCLFSVLRTLGTARSDLDDLPELIIRFFNKEYLDSRLYYIYKEELHRLWLDYLKDFSGLIFERARNERSFEDEDYQKACALIKEKLEDFESTTLLDALAWGELPFGRKGITKTSEDGFLKLFYSAAAFHFLDLAYEDFQNFLQNRPDYNARLSFDQLIKRCYSMVCEGDPEKRAQLRSTLGSEFRAVLLDEFQDTDRLQWELFHELFSSRLLMAVGDPKQAIYGFRGADIATYAEAKESFALRGELRKNFRSSPELLEALNALFAQAFSALPADFNRLEYRAVEAGLASRDFPGLQYKGQVLAPLGLMKIPAAAQSSQEKSTAILKISVQEITKLLKDPPLIPTKQGIQKLEAEHIAVLVENFRQAFKIRDLLKQTGIPAALQGRGDLKNSREAKELAYLCWALENPRDQKAVLSFALSRLGGLAYQELDEFLTSPAYSYLQSYLLEARESLKSRGFLALFDDFQKGKHLSLPQKDAEIQADLWLRLFSQEGENALRSYANFEHLSELLQQAFDAEPQKLLNPAYTYQKLLQKLSSSEDSPLRLERDKGAVCIMTQHASKGLEFPVVFALIGLVAQKERRRAGTLPLYENQVGQKIRRFPQVLNLKNEVREQAVERRYQQEKLRLYYVACTRAKELLYLPWYEARSDEKPKLLQEVFCQEGIFSLTMEAAKYRFVELEVENPAETEESAQKKEQTMQGPALAEDLKKHKLRPRPESCISKVQSSYTSLKKHLHTQDLEMSPFYERSDFSALKEEDPPTVSPLDEEKEFLGSGKDWGNVFHETMAELDIAAFLEAWEKNAPFGEYPELQELFHKRLSSNGFFRSKELPKDKDHFQDHPLVRELKQALNPCLGDLGEPLGNLLASPSCIQYRELEFHAYLERSVQIPHSLLASLFKDYPVDQGPSSGLQIPSGYLNGSLDLCFRDPHKRWHIVDWKTNRLSNLELAPEAACEEIMQDCAYYLQALLYQSILSLILRGEPLGSAYYIFTRSGLQHKKDTAYYIEASIHTQVLLEDFIASSGLHLGFSDQGQPHE